MILKYSRFNEQKQQAMKSFSILPSMAADVLPKLEDFVYFESDLPDPLTLLQRTGALEGIHEL